MGRDKVSELLGKIERLEEKAAQSDRETEKMKVSHLFLKTLFNEIHEEIMVVDSNFLIQDVNRVFLECYRLKRADVLGKRCYEVTAHSDGPCNLGRQSCPLEKAKKTGKRVEITHYVEAPKGKPAKEMVRIMYPFAPGGKNPKYFLEISRDVTEYRNLIRKLKASEKKVRAILDTATDAILSIDAGHKIILFNDAAQRIFGYSRHEVLGKDLELLIPAQYGDHYRFVKRFLETKKARIMGKTLSLKAMRKNGEEFPVELGLSYHEMSGQVTFTAIIRDVSTQKQMEKNLLQSERLAAVGQAVAHVAHEIKNPLMIIGGFSHQVRKSLTDDKAKQKVDMILDEVSRLEKLVANLGDFTKEYRLVKRPADINSVIMDVMKILAEIYSSEKYRFKADLCSDMVEIHCDPDKLKQVFMNILTNGIEAMEGGGTITINSKMEPDGIEVRIRDEGVGINEEDLLHIFEPFYTTRERGSGLGLCISYKIVEAHAGEIEAFSMPGEGTTFVIRLPGR